MSAELDELAKSLYNGQIPSIWKVLAPATLKTLGNWMIHFLKRNQQYLKWVSCVGKMIKCQPIYLHWHDICCCSKSIHFLRTGQWRRAVCDVVVWPTHPRVLPDSPGSGHLQEEWLAPGQVNTVHFCYWGMRNSEIHINIYQYCMLHNVYTIPSLWHVPA